MRDVPRTPEGQDNATALARIPVLGEARMSGGRLAQTTRVVYGSPVLHRLAGPSSPGQGHAYYGLWIAVDLIGLPPRVRCIATYLRIGFDTSGAVGVDVRAAHPDDLPDTMRRLPGWAARIGLARDPGPTSLTGVGQDTIGLFAGGFDDRGSPLPLSHTIQVIATAPADLDELTGSLRFDASFTTGRLRPTMFHARSAGTQPFAVRPEEPAPAFAAGVRLCLAADIERFSRFANPDAMDAQRRLVTALHQARRHAGIDEELVATQESGDGQFAVLPVGLDESIVIPKLVEGLHAALASTNLAADDHHRIRVRLALHRGFMTRGANGWIGDSAIAVHRLLDSGALREALRRNPAADFVLIVPDTLFTDVIAHRYGRLAPESFRSVTIEIRDKQFSQQAWIHAPET